MTKRRQVSTKYNESDAEAWFKWWYENDRNYKATAKNFKVSPTTVRRHARRRDWVLRAEKIRADVANAHDRKIVKQEVSNVQMAKACLKKEIRQYLDKEHKAVGDINAIVKLMRYIDEVEGNMPNGGDYRGGSILDEFSPDERESLRKDITAIRAYRQQLAESR